MNNATRNINAANAQAQAFLLVPYECPTKRADSLLEASDYARAAIKHAVRGGRDDLAMKLLELAQEIEAGATK